MVSPINESDWTSKMEWPADSNESAVSELCWGEETNGSLCPPWINESSITNFVATNNSFFPSPFFQAVIYSLYSLVFLLALVGNMLVCAVVFTSVRKWTVTNFFIVNMAAGDILMAFFCIPFTFVPTFVLLYWPFGSVMCRIVSYSQAVSVFVSAYTMVAISSDRYLAIVYPLRPRMTRNQAKWIILFVWMVAVLTALPTLLVSELVLPTDSDWHQSGDRYICQEQWADREQHTQYTYVLLVLQYCFPLAVLVFTYGRIGLEIWGKKTPGEAHQHRDLRLARSKRKMIKMMIIVVVFFAFCWLPFNLIQIIGDQYPEIWNWRKINYVFFACHWLAMSHSAYNPIIYCCFNSKFRQGFHNLAVLCGCGRWCSDGTDSMAVGSAVGHWAVANCDCGRETLGGSIGGMPLQRANTFTSATYTAAGCCSHHGRRSTVVTGKNNASRVILPPSNNQHRLVNQQHAEIIGIPFRTQPRSGANIGPPDQHPMLHFSSPCTVLNRSASSRNHNGNHAGQRQRNGKRPKLVFRASNTFANNSSSGHSSSPPPTSSAVRIAPSSPGSPVTGATIVGPSTINGGATAESHM